MSEYFFDANTPSTARMYDYYLGGKDNFQADRVAAQEVLRSAPSLRKAARDNRRFMARAVRYCASSGIRQFIDVGTGIPTYPNVSDVARAIQPDAAVVGIDNDPHVLVHDNAILDGVHMIDGDMRNPASFMDGAVLQQHIDWSEPVAVLFIAALHFVTDAEGPADIVAAFRKRMVSGSLVVISHVSSTGADLDEVAAVERVYRRATSPGVFRSHERIRSLFDGFELVKPGLLPVQHWPTTESRITTRIPVFGGVGRVPPLGPAGAR